jgi:hypothetical protein
MAPVAVPTTRLDDLKIDEPKVEKKVDVIDEEEDDEEDEGEGGETGATGGMPLNLLYFTLFVMQSVLIFRCKEEEEKEEV